MSDKSNYDKYRELLRAAAAEKDSLTRTRLLQAAERYYGLDILEAKARIKQAKPSYGIKTMIGYILILLLIAFLVVVFVTLLVGVDVVKIAGIIGIFLLIVAAVIGFRATDKLSEGNFLQALSAITTGLKSIFNTGSASREQSESGALPSGGKAKNLPPPKVDFGND